MSKKGLKSMKDEKQELQKQIGCITGFFQLFDRHRFITGQRTTKYIQNASSSGIQLFISLYFLFFGILFFWVASEAQTPDLAYIMHCPYQPS